MSHFVAEEIVSFFRGIKFSDFRWQNMFEFVLVSIFVSLLVPNVHCNESTVRKTTNGPIEGIEEVSAMGQKYYAFRSIPFAEPPITGIDPYTGENVDRRFKVRLSIFLLI